MRIKVSIISFIIGAIICLILWMNDIRSVGFILLLIVMLLSDFIKGSIFIQDNFYLNSLNELDYPIVEKKIALTFDDGIHVKNTPKVLAILKQHQVQATFFLIGKNIETNTEILNRMLEDGHQIGNHSYEHGFWFSMKSSKNMLAEIQNTNEIVKKYTGIELKLFRPPYGVTNPMVAKALKLSGLRSIGWSLRSKDTVAKSKLELLTKLKKRVKRNDIILLHDRCDLTVEVLTEFIEDCKSRGYKFVTIPS